MNAETERVSVHESAHAVVAHRLGRRARGLSVIGGKQSAGVARYVRPRITRRDWERLDQDTPWPLWPASAKRSIEIRAVITAAGAAGEELLYWAQDAPARVPDPLHLQLADRSAPSARDVARLAAVVDDVGVVTDLDLLDGLSRAVFADDATRLAWLQWVGAEAAALVARHAGQVERLAAVAAEKGRLTGAAVRAILDDQGARS